MPPDPDTLGRFVIDRQLGRGGMGVVYLARDPDLHRPVALKVLPRDRPLSPDRTERFLREARTLAGLNHPNLASVHSLESADDGSRILVMEYVEGQSLAERIARGPIPVFEALSICGQVAAGIEAAHDAGVIHRDLKPSNVMLSRDGVAKVLDFGLARRAGEAMTPGAESGISEPLPAPSEDETAITRPGQSPGTPGYMAPEQIQGRRHDHQADIFAFGALAYECLVGSPAFAGISIEHRVVAALNDEPDWSALPPETPEPVRAMLRKCLRKDQGDRLGDISGCRVALSRATYKPRDDAARQLSLPVPPTRFIGREHEIADLERLLGSARLLTLIGAGGCGKTRLAIELARRISERYPGGVHLVDLSALTNPELVRQSILARFAIHQQDKGAPFAALSDRVAGSPTLILLDNCEHLAQACAECAGAILAETDGVAVLATSRVPLNVPGEQTYRVPSLAQPGDRGEPTPESVRRSEAGALFLDRARLVRPGFSIDEAGAAAVARVCRRLDGIPFAIELAASRVKALTVSDIERRLNESFALLESPGTPSLSRHQTLRASIEWSIGLLSEKERLLLRRLCVFSGGWTIEAAERVCVDGDDGPPEGSRIRASEVLDLLMRLIDRSLVMFSEEARLGRYRLLETVRQYLNDQLDTGEVAAMLALRRKHVEYCRELAETLGAEVASPRQAEAIGRLNAEHDNVRGALEACRSLLEDGEAGLSIATAMRHYWYIRGHAEEALRWTEAMLALRGPRSDEAEANALNAVGAYAWRLGMLGEARSAFEEAASVFERLGERERVAAMLNNLGLVLKEEGELEPAIEIVSRALSNYEALGDVPGMARTKLNLGWFLQIAGEYKGSQKLLGEALPVFRTRADSQRIAATLYNLGVLSYRLEGGNPRASAHLRESLRIRKQLGDRRGLAEVALWLGVVEHSCGRQVLSARLLTIAERLAEEAGLTFAAGECEEKGLVLGALEGKMGASETLEIRRVAKAAPDPEAFLLSLIQEEGASES